MKTQVILVSALILMAFFMPLKNSGQDTLTVGQVYDFEVGDVFHYEEVLWTTNLKNIYEITDKYYSVNNDTLYYTRDIKHLYWSDSSWLYLLETDTIFYTQLNSLINDGLINFIYSNQNQYNGRLVNEYAITDCDFITFVEGCGIGRDLYIDEDDFFDTQLRYYKKGEEEWGSPYVITGINMVPEFFQITVYPNPALDYINIKFTKSDLLIKEAIIYNHLGQKTLVAKPVNNTVDVSKLTPGIYILEVVTENRTIREKLMIE